MSASDLNTEFNNIIQNALTLISPITGTLDLDGNELILDGDADTSITANTDDQIDYKLGGTDIFRMLTVASAVNGINWTGSVTTESVKIQAFGSDTDIDINLTPKGNGELLTPAGADEILKQRVFN